MLKIKKDLCSKARSGMGLGAVERQPVAEPTNLNFSSGGIEGGKSGGPGPGGDDTKKKSEAAVQQR